MKAPHWEYHSRIRSEEPLPPFEGTFRLINWKIKRILVACISFEFTKKLCFECCSTTSPSGECFLSPKLDFLLSQIGKEMSNSFESVDVMDSRIL
jgi:hypothetical protein